VIWRWSCVGRIMRPAATHWRNQSKHHQLTLIFFIHVSRTFKVNFNEYCACPPLITLLFLFCQPAQASAQNCSRKLLLLAFSIMLWYRPPCTKEVLLRQNKCPQDQVSPGTHSSYGNRTYSPPRKCGLLGTFILPALEQTGGLSGTGHSARKPTGSGPAA